MSNRAGIPQGKRPITGGKETYYRRKRDPPVTPGEEHILRPVEQPLRFLGVGGGERERKRGKEPPRVLAGAVSTQVKET